MQIFATKPINAARSESLASLGGGTSLSLANNSNASAEDCHNRPKWLTSLYAILIGFFLATVSIYIIPNDAQAVTSTPAIPNAELSSTATEVEAGGSFPAISKIDTFHQEFTVPLINNDSSKYETFKLAQISNAESSTQNLDLIQDFAGTRGHDESAARDAPDSNPWIDITIPDPPNNTTYIEGQTITVVVGTTGSVTTTQQLSVPLRGHSGRGDSAPNLIESITPNPVIIPMG